VLVAKVFVGHDWAEAHHDVHVTDDAGRQPAAMRLPEGIEGVRRFHELVAAFAEEPADVTVATETARLVRRVVGGSGLSGVGSESDVDVAL
jgi:hypothetical protein